MNIAAEITKAIPTSSFFLLKQSGCHISFFCPRRKSNAGIGRGGGISGGLMTVRHEICRYWYCCCCCCRFYMLSLFAAAAPFLSLLDVHLTAKSVTKKRRRVILAGNYVTIAVGEIGALRGIFFWKIVTCQRCVLQTSFVHVCGNFVA